MIYFNSLIFFSRSPEVKEADARVDYPSHQMVLYVEKGDGSYGPLQTGSYMAKNYIDDFWDKQNHVRELAIEGLLSGELSPIGYYMALLQMTPANVARRAGTGVGRVKRHRLSRHFAGIGPSLLKRYAAVFNVPLESLASIEVHGGERAAQLRQKNKNPFVMITGAKEEGA
jgi:hypothetical protein